MKLLIIIDQEGCSNVVPSQTNEIRTQHMMTQLENFILSVNSDYEIEVLDCHDNGLNVIPLKTKFPNIVFTAQIWNFNIKANYDAAVLIGFHAAQGIVSPFAHTFRNEISKIILDGECVGEVTLLVKWLQSNNIPIVFVHGESELKNEVNSLKLPFIPNSAIPQMDQNLIFHNIKYQDSLPIKVQLKNNNYLNAFPSTIFKFEQNSLLFFNINNFFSNLSYISIFLNAARNYYLMYIKSIFNQVKWNYSFEDLKKLNDNRLNNILESQSITNEDVEYIKQRLKIG